MKFPSIKDVSAELREIHKCLVPVDGEVEIRLQVTESDSHGHDPKSDGRMEWYIHCGDPCYDTDHRGYWGNSSIPTGRFNSRELAKDLLSQVRDQAHDVLLRKNILDRFAEVQEERKH